MALSKVVDRVVYASAFGTLSIVKPQIVQVRTGKEEEGTLARQTWSCKPQLVFAYVPRNEVPY